MLLNPALLRVGSSNPTPALSVPFADAGAGVASLTLTAGSGTATFARASTAWTKLSSGLWASVASGSPRSTYTGYDTAVGTYAGYFTEGAGIQLVTPTASIRDMTNAAWVKTTMTAAKTSTGIDGVGSSCTRLTASAGNATAIQTLAAAASSRTYSCWIKRVTGTGNIELTQDGTTFTNIAGSINSSTFTRVQLNASQLNATFGIRIVTNGDAIDVDFNQFEAGAVATSPMDTAGSVRNADSLSFQRSGNFNNAAGSIVVTASFGGLATNNRVVIGDSAAASGPMNVINGTTIRMSDGSTLHDFSVSAIPVNTLTKLVTTWGVAENAYSAGVAGTPTGQTFDGSMDGVSALAVDQNGTMYGTVKDLKVFLVELSAAQAIAQ